MNPLFRLRSALQRLKNHQPTPSLQFTDYPLETVAEALPLDLKKGDRLAICGDSITEQRLYSVLVESYLTICRPELEISVRHYGWSGEKSGEFLARMEADVLRFHPTVATTLYGMNDFFYIPYEEEIAADFRRHQEIIIQKFKKADCRVLLGTPTIIDAVPDWVKTARGSQYDLNLTLCRYRNLAIHLAKEQDVSCADVYLPMLQADFAAKQRYGPHFKIAGKDGVHPDWAGQAIIAFVFLKQLGMKGDMGTLVFDGLTENHTGTNGHTILASEENTLRIRSERLPFCPGAGPIDVSASLRAGMEWVPFDDELNRFILRISSPVAPAYDITWGKTTRRYPAEALVAGINLAKDFQENPLVVHFGEIWNAIATKQAFETRQYKEMLNSPEGSLEREAAFELTEGTRARYLRAIQAARRPIDHEVLIVPAT